MASSDFRPGDLVDVVGGTYKGQEGRVLESLKVRVKVTFQMDENKQLGYCPALAAHNLALKSTVRFPIPMEEQASRPGLSVRKVGRLLIRAAASTEGGDIVVEADALVDLIRQLGGLDIAMLPGDTEREI